MIISLNQLARHISLIKGGYPKAELNISQFRALMVGQMIGGIISIVVGFYLLFSGAGVIF